MGRPKKNINTVSNPQVPTELDQRKEFIQWLARDAFMELVKHNGKVNNDYAGIVVAAATDLADRLALGVKKKPSKLKDVPAKAEELINLVDTEEESE